MINLYSFLSANYHVLKSNHQPKGNEHTDSIELTVYYHPDHEYNINRLMASMKHSLDYYSTHFGPYPIKQLRIMEFPRYRGFAQSFPTSIPYSESMGFNMQIDDDEDVDMVLYHYSSLSSTSMVGQPMFKEKI